MIPRRGGTSRYRLKRSRTMIILGVELLLLGLLMCISILYTLGIILLVIGVILYILGAVGRPIGGRRHYWEPRPNLAGPMGVVRP